MSVPEHEEEPPKELPPPPRWNQPPAAEPPRARSAGTALGTLVALLVIVIIGVAASPFWAPAVAPMLPWGERAAAPAAVNSDSAAMLALQTRLDTAETALKQETAQLQQLVSEAATLKLQAATATATVKAVLSDAQLSRLDGDEQILRDMADRITVLEKRPVPPAKPMQSPQSAAAIKALQDQVTKLAAGTAATADGLAKLQEAVARANAGERAGHAQLLALANLRVAAEGAAPFGAELAAAQALAGSNNAAMTRQFATLNDVAKTGLPTLAALRQRFDRAVAPAILRAPRDVGNESWWQQIVARLERLVVVRRIAPDGAMPRDATEAAVARAENALDAGDLAAAVKALEPLTGAAAKAAAPWLAQAKERLAAEATLAALWHDAVTHPEAKP
jgi:hypothetical protein